MWSENIFNKDFYHLSALYGSSHIMIVAKLNVAKYISLIAFHKRN